MAPSTDYQGRIQATIHLQHTNYLALTKANTNKGRRTRGSKPRSKAVSQGRHNRRMPRSKSNGPSVPVLYIKGSNEEPPNFGLPPNKSMYSGEPFQDGRGACSSRLDRTKRLHGKNRFERCIYSNPNPHGLKATSRVQKRRDSLPIQVAQFWLIKCRSLNFLQDTTLCNRTVKGPRHQTSVLFRRHLYSSSGQFSFTRRGKADNLTPRIFGIYNQFSKECADSFPHTRLFRFPVQHQENGDQSPRYEDQEPPITTETNFTPNLEIMPVDGRSDGESHGDDTRSERGVITYPIHAERFGKIVNQESSQLGRSVRVVTAATPRRDSVIATINYLEE